LSRFAVTTVSKNLAFMIDSPPEIAGLAVDLHEHLIQVPSPLDEAAHARNPLLSDLGREHRTKPVPPKSDGLMADVDPALSQEILDISQRKRVPHVHHDDQTNHFWRAVEITERVPHGPKLPRPGARKIALTVPARKLGGTPKVNVRNGVLFVWPADFDPSDKTLLLSLVGRFARLLAARA